MSSENKVRAEALKAEGNTLAGGHDYPAAVLKYTEAIELDPKTAVFYSNRAHCYLELEE